jgi:hypothetical protein
VPVGYILISDPGRNVKHDDPALSLDVISIAETTKLLLSSSVPDVEANGAKAGGKFERVDLYPEGGDVFLFEFAGQVALLDGMLDSEVGLAVEGELTLTNVVFPVPPSPTECSVSK